MRVIEAKSIFAHRLLYNGHQYDMSIAQITDDGLNISISPFVKEVPGTIFVSGTVRISLKDGKILAECDM